MSAGPLSAEAAKKQQSRDALQSVEANYRQIVTAILEIEHLKTEAVERQAREDRELDPDRLPDTSTVLASLFVVFLCFFPSFFFNSPLVGAVLLPVAAVDLVLLLVLKLLVGLGVPWRARTGATLAVEVLVVSLLGLSVAAAAEGLMGAVISQSGADPPGRQPSRAVAYLEALCAVPAVAVACVTAYYAHAQRPDDMDAQPAVLREWDTENTTG